MAGVMGWAMISCVRAEQHDELAPPQQSEESHLKTDSSSRTPVLKSTATEAGHSHHSMDSGGPMADNHLGSHGRPAADKQPEAQSTQQETSSEAEHVPPAPPQNPLHNMPYSQMAKMMQMDDRERFGSIMLDQLEYRDTHEGAAGTWEALGWYGSDYNKLFVKTEGERVRRQTEDARVDVLWDRIVSRWWSLQAGARQDFGQGPSRTWVALGVQGLAQYWFDVEATFYVGEEGRTAARVKTEYDLLITQRWILQPEAEANLYGKPDPARGVGSGLSDLDVALRLRYEVRRQLAPYVGVAWTRRFGRSADLARADGGSASDVQFLAGVRIWL